MREWARYDWHQRARDCPRRSPVSERSASSSLHASEGERHYLSGTVTQPPVLILIAEHGMCVSLLCAYATDEGTKPSYSPALRGAAFLRDSTSSHLTQAATCHASTAPAGI
jgi:hypothetical protein